MADRRLGKARILGTPSAQRRLLVVGLRALEDRQTVSRLSNNQPVAGIGNMALAEPGPRAFQEMHVVTLTQDSL